MANVKDISYNSGFQTFNFKDEDGDIITSCVINPSDIGLMARCEEVSEFFEKEREFLEGAETPQQMLEANNIIQEKIDYLLGTEDDTIFKKPLTATTVMPDGNIFAELVMDKVFDTVKPELAKRVKKKQQNLAKYTAKYN